MRHVDTNIKKIETKKRLPVDERVPKATKLIEPTFAVIKSLGGSATNQEILNLLIETLKLPRDVTEVMHRGSGDRVMTELNYQAAWARTYLKASDILTNNGRGVWSINPKHLNLENVDTEKIVSHYRTKKHEASLEILDKTSVVEPSTQEDFAIPETGTDEEANYTHWKEDLAKILMTMDAYGFERLTQRILRECGFVEVSVTKKSGDGGIDGFGKLKINGIFSFSVAFQCKRYSKDNKVTAQDIRNFRGSLSTDIEKGIFITTGVFTNAAQEEASSSGKKQIDLITGEELINKIAEYGIGVREVKTYEIDREFFENI